MRRVPVHETVLVVARQLAEGVITTTNLLAALQLGRVPVVAARNTTYGVKEA